MEADVPKETSDDRLDRLTLYVGTAWTAAAWVCGFSVAADHGANFAQATTWGNVAALAVITLATVTIQMRLMRWLGRLPKSDET